MALHRSVSLTALDSEPDAYIRSGNEGYTSDVTKRLIDVDDDKLAAARELLGTSTTKATVNGAFDEVIALAKRREALLNVRAAAGSDDLADDERRRGAWR